MLLSALSRHPALYSLFPWPLCLSSLFPVLPPSPPSPLSRVPPFFPTCTFLSLVYLSFLGTLPSCAIVPTHFPTILPYCFLSVHLLPTFSLLFCPCSSPFSCLIVLPPQFIFQTVMLTRPFPLDLPGRQQQLHKKPCGFLLLVFEGSFVEPVIACNRFLIASENVPQHSYPLNLTLIAV
jgi:hypothetical protein